MRSLQRYDCSEPEARNSVRPFVNWSFNPGTKPNGQPRTAPPYSQEELITAFEEWIAEGTPCPTN